VKLLTDMQAVAWCGRRGLSADGAVPSSRIRLPDGPSVRIHLGVPGDAIAAVGLAYTLLMTGVSEYEERNFGGALIWLHRWEIGSEQIDEAGYMLLDGIRAASRGSIEIASAPAQLFDEKEFVLAYACLVLPMLFQWDAHLVPTCDEFFAFVSHEGRIDLITRDPQTHARLLQRFNAWVLPDFPAGSIGA
jgi:hypothetical protein